MNNYYIYLSSSEKIKINPKDIREYLQKIKAEAPKEIREVIDEICNSEEIDLDRLLNKLFYVSGESGVKITCIEKATDIVYAKEDFVLIKGKKGDGDKIDHCVYVANLDEGDTDNIGYWGLGHANAKNMKIIGYQSGKCNKKVSNDLLMCVGEEVCLDIYQFMTKLANSLESLGYKIPSSRYLAKQRKSWNNGSNLPRDIEEYNV